MSRKSSSQVTLSTLLTEDIIRLYKIKNEFDRQWREYQELKSEYSDLKLLYTEVKHTIIPTAEQLLYLL